MLPTFCKVHWWPSASVTDHLVPVSTTATRRLPDAPDRAASNVACRAASPVRSVASKAVPAAFRSLFAKSARLSAVMLADSEVGVESPVSARTVTALSAAVVVTVVPERVAVTSLSTVFSATETPTESATPVEPNAAARETPCALELIRLSSREITETVLADAVPPDRVAATLVAIWLVTETPDPDTPTAFAPAAIATDPAKTEASIACTLLAEIDSAPVRLTVLASTRAVTPAGARDRLMSCHRSGLA